MFLTHFCTKSECWWRGNYASHVLVSPTKSVHILNDGVAVTSLFANLQHNTSATKVSLCQITLNWTLSHKFDKWCKFSSCIILKSHKKKLHKKRPACIVHIICQTYSIYVSFLWDCTLQNYPYNKIVSATGTKVRLV